MSQLTNYIQKELDKGFSKDLITKKLLQAGYTQQEISESFTSLKSAEPLLRRKFVDELHHDVHIQWSKWLFGILAVLLVAAFGYLIYLYEGEITLPQTELSTACDAIADSLEKDKCYLSLAAEGEETCSLIQSKILGQLCEQKIWETDPCNYLIFTGGDKEACLWEQAIATKDASYCNRKTTDDIACLVQLAIETKDTSVCGHELFCYQKYAVAVEDKTVCEQAINPLHRESCLTYYTEKLSRTSNFIKQNIKRIDYGTKHFKNGFL